MPPEVPSHQTEPRYSDEVIKERLKEKGFELGSHFLYRDSYTNRELVGIVVGCSIHGNVIVQTHPPYFRGTTAREHYPHIAESYQDLAKRELCFTASVERLVPISETEYQQRMNTMTTIPEEVKVDTEIKVGHWVRFLRIDGVIQYYSCSKEVIQRASKIEILDGKIESIKHNIASIKIDGQDHGFDLDAVVSMNEIPKYIAERMTQIEAEQLLVSAYDVKVGQIVNYFDMNTRFLIPGVIKSVSNKDGEFTVMINPNFTGKEIKVSAEHIFVPENVLKGLEFLKTNGILWGVDTETPEGKFRLLFAEHSTDGDSTLLFFDRGQDELFVMTLEQFLPFREEKKSLEKNLKIEAKLAEAGLKINMPLDTSVVGGTGNVVGLDLERDVIILEKNEEGWYPLTIANGCFHSTHTPVNKSVYTTIGFSWYKKEQERKARETAQKEYDRHIEDSLAAVGLAIGDKIIDNIHPYDNSLPIETEAIVVGFQRGMPVLHQSIRDFHHAFEPNWAEVHSTYKNLPAAGFATFGITSVQKGKLKYEERQKENLLKLLKEKEQRDLLEQQKAMKEAARQAQQKAIFNGIEPGDTVYNHFIRGLYPYEYVADRVPLKVLSLDAVNKTCRVQLPSGAANMNVANLFKDTVEFTPLINKMMMESQTKKRAVDDDLNKAVKAKDLKIGDWILYGNKEYGVESFAVVDVGTFLVQARNKEDDSSVRITLSSVAKIKYSNSGLMIGDKVRQIYLSQHYPYPVENVINKHFEVVGFNRDDGIISLRKFVNGVADDQVFDYKDVEFYQANVADSIAQKLQEESGEKKRQDDEKYKQSLKEKGISKGDTLVSETGELFEATDTFPHFFDGKPVIKGIYKEGNDKRVKWFWLKGSHKAKQTLVLKSNAKTALYRVGANQAVNLVKASLITLMQNRGNPDSIIQNFADFLKTEMGTAFTATVASLALQQLKLKDPRIAPLVQELQIQAMATAGNVALDTLAAEIVPHLKNIFQDLEESEKRIGARTSSMLGSEVQEECQIEDCSTMPQVAVK